MTTNMNPIIPSGKSRRAFISGNPDVPKLVRVYAAIIVVLSILGMVGMVLAIVFELICVFILKESTSILSLGAISVGFIICFIITFIMFRIGKGLSAGKRNAVYGFCIVGSLIFIRGLFLLFTHSVIDGISCFVSVVIFYVPPLVTAFRHWKAFK